ncbi:MAG: DNA-binding protein [Actinomycetia bacterium]|nr:DNA-binding protein [Actinomycetes bacterium]
MSDELKDAEAWVCAHCNVALVAKTVRLNYLNKDFEHELMCCPQCGQVFIDESLALGKMFEVERSLEDK